MQLLHEKYPWSHQGAVRGSHTHLCRIAAHRKINATVQSPKLLLSLNNVLSSKVSFMIDIDSHGIEPPRIATPAFELVTSMAPFRI